jgi:hypothetical protein
MVAIIRFTGPTIAPLPHLTENTRHTDIPAEHTSDLPETDTTRCAVAPAARIRVTDGAEAGSPRHEDTRMFCR